MQPTAGATQNLAVLCFAAAPPRCRPSSRLSSTRRCSRQRRSLCLGSTTTWPTSMRNGRLQTSWDPIPRQPVRGQKSCSSGMAWLPGISRGGACVSLMPACDGSMPAAGCSLLAWTLETKRHQPGTLPHTAGSTPAAMQGLLEVAAAQAAAQAGQAKWPARVARQHATAHSAGGAARLLLAAVRVRGGGMAAAGSACTAAVLVRMSSPTEACCWARVREGEGHGTLPTWLRAA